METSDLFLPSSNKLVQDLITNKIDTYRFFDYDIHSPLVYEVRKNEVVSRKFQREELVKYLLSYNELYHVHENTINNIKKLLDPSSVVVIGGQQAGILTGPLYTIHKIISILKLAKEQEEKLRTPVIPVFWIAGEDHDFAEINHLFIKEKDAVKKKILPQKQVSKSMVSTIQIDKDIVSQWIHEVFETYGETEHTNQILTMLEKNLHRSDTYVDFFIHLINDLFHESGLVLIDSGSKELRKLEANYFKQIVDKNKEIHDALLFQQETLQSFQYSKTIHMNVQSANLFYDVNGERVLLEYDAEHDIFKGKNNECILCREEIDEIANKKPELLSNNVVTRPLMQELLFPTLAFISGPGEVSYWAELKKVFSVIGIKMPPVVPRLMMTIVERTIESHLDDIEISISQALTGDLERVKNRWLAENTSSYDEMFTKAKQDIEHIHKQLRSEVIKEDNSLSDLLLKNAEIIQDQLDFIRNSVNKRILQKNDVVMKRFTRIERSLLPISSPQERVWNIFYYLNKYGPDFTAKLLEPPYEFNWKHKIIKI